MKCYLYIVLVTCLVPISDAMAQTLWQKRDPQKAFIFQDLKARRIGDNLTIIVNELTDVANSDSRGLNKQSSASADAEFSYGGTGSSGSGSIDFSSASRRQFNGDTNFSSEREFRDRFTVTVVDVLPNGNLVISGRRIIFVEGDRRWITLSGIVRDLDIREDNSVLSGKVANLSINYAGAGTEQHFINQGWFSKRINKLWPF